MKRKTTPLDGTNGQLMVMAAHRYCLGRRTYIVRACCEWLKLNWQLFEDKTKNMLLRDTIESLMDGHAGDDCDVYNWTTFARFAFNEITDENQQWVRDSVSHKDKDWPL